MIILRRVAIKAQNKVESLTASRGHDECVWLLLLSEDAPQRFLRPEWAQKWPSLKQNGMPSKPKPLSVCWWPSGVCTQPQVWLSHTIMLTLNVTGFPGFWLLCMGLHWHRDVRVGRVHGWSGRVRNDQRKQPLWRSCGRTDGWEHGGECLVEPGWKGCWLVLLGGEQHPAEHVSREGPRPRGKQNF